MGGLTLGWICLERNIGACLETFSVTAALPPNAQLSVLSSFCVFRSFVPGVSRIFQIYDVLCGNSQLVDFG